MDFVGTQIENKSENNDNDTMVYDIPISSHLKTEQHNSNELNASNELNEIINNRNKKELNKTVLWKILKIISIILSLFIGLWVIAVVVISIGFKDYTFIVFSKESLISVFVSFGFILVVGITMNIIYDKYHYSQ